MKLGCALPIQTAYLKMRGNVYQFVTCIPTELAPHFDRQSIRKSLKRVDKIEALQKVERLAQTYKAEFSELRENRSLPPPEKRRTPSPAWLSVADFVDTVAEPKRQAYAGQCWKTW